MGMVGLPAGLAEMAPGPGLAAGLAAVLAGVLAGVDRSRLSGSDLVVLVRVRNRQVAWEQAQLLADVHELARTAAVGPDSTDRLADYEQFAEVEVAFALACTHGGASAGGWPGTVCTSCRRWGRRWWRGGSIWPRRG